MTTTSGVAVPDMAAGSYAQRNTRYWKFMKNSSACMRMPLSSNGLVSHSARPFLVPA